MEKCYLTQDIIIITHIFPNETKFKFFLHQEIYLNVKMDKK
jgi:hypothetical protein